MSVPRLLGDWVRPGLAVRVVDLQHVSPDYREFDGALGTVTDTASRFGVFVEFGPRPRRSEVFHRSELEPEDLTRWFLEAPMGTVVLDAKHHAWQKCMVSGECWVHASSYALDPTHLADAFPFTVLWMPDEG